jgi:hypothetical protein
MSASVGTRKDMDEEPRDWVSEAVRLRTEVEDLRHQLAIAQRVSGRRAQEVDRLERELALRATECEGYRRQYEERSRLVGLIFASRSWRVAQWLRRFLGRT